MRSKWVKTDTTPPSRDGKYWVYPYFNLEGSRFVTIARYENGDWEDKYKNQRFQYWQKIEVPEAPRLRD